MRGWRGDLESSGFGRRPDLIRRRQTADSQTPASRRRRLAGRASANMRLEAGVVALVTARDGRSAAEQQPSVRVVQQRLPGRLRAKASASSAVVVAHDRDARESVAASRQSSVCSQSLAASRRLDEDDERVRASRGARHQLGEFGEAGARAVALGMREHHERRTRGVQRRAALRGHRAGASAGVPGRLA